VLAAHYEQVVGRAPETKAMIADIFGYAIVDWDTALLWLWISTTTVLAILYVAAWLRLALQAKRWPRETIDAVSVVVADDVGPAVLGFLRPCIVLPRWLIMLTQPRSPSIGRASSWRGARGVRNAARAAPRDREVAGGHCYEHRFSDRDRRRRDRRQTHQRCGRRAHS
jgi:hypothetical protein